MKNNQRGFGAFELLLIVVIVGLIGGIGWYFVQRDDSKQSPSVSKQHIQTKSYTDSSKLYSLQYPETWAVKEADDCCDGPPRDYTQVSRSVRFAPPARIDTNGYGLNVQADRTDKLAKSIEQSWIDNKHTAKSKTINGYTAKYVKVTFTGDAENYIDHNYLITQNEASVFVTFRENYHHQYPRADWSAAQDMDAFNAILHSIRFDKAVGPN